MLGNRGVADPANFFNLSWESVQSPYDLDNIELVADKILEHCSNGSNIALLIDSDADGLTSSAVLTNYLRAAFPGNPPNIEFIAHPLKGHGLDDTAVMRQLRDEIMPDLLIIPDASGKAKQYAALNELGIEIVVIDHHDMPEKGDGEMTIVTNCKQSANYRNKELSGVGMVWQLCRVFDDKLGLELANNWLDLVAVGLVADVMDLRSDETRFLVTEGLKHENIKSNFLIQCRETMAYSLDRDKKNPDDIRYGPKQIGWTIGPHLNATARIGSADEIIFLFKALLDEESSQIVNSGKRNAFAEMVPYTVEAIRQITNTKSRQTRREKKLVELISEVISDEGLNEDQVILIAVDDFDDDQKAMTGLIAGKIADFYSRPCFIVYKNGDHFNGSARCPDDNPAFENFRKQCEDSKLFIYAAGHAGAFGVCIHEDRVQDVRDYFNEQYANITLEPTYKVDFILDADDMYIEELAEILTQYKSIWGQGIKTPMIAITNVPVTRRALYYNDNGKTPVLKCALPSAGSVLKFYATREEYESMLLPFDGGAEQYYLMTFVGELEQNEFNGVISPQLKWVDYRIDSVEYDF